MSFFIYYTFPNSFRLPRRAPRHNSESIFREDTESITPSPSDGRAGSTEYKPTTSKPPTFEDDFLNDIEILPALEPLQEVFEKPKAAPLRTQVFDAVPLEPEPPLHHDIITPEEEEHFIEFNKYESLKLPQPQQISQLPPIDSDLISAPNEALGHPILNTYSLAGQFVRPRPNRYRVHAKPAAAPLPSHLAHKETYSAVPVVSEEYAKPPEAPHIEVYNHKPVEPVQVYQKPVKPIEVYNEPLAVSHAPVVDLLSETTPHTTEVYSELTSTTGAHDAKPAPHSDLYLKAAPLKEHHSEPVLINEHYRIPSPAAINEHYQNPSPPSHHENYNDPIIKHYSSPVLETEPPTEYYYKPAPPNYESYNYQTSPPSNEQYTNTIHHVAPAPVSTTTTPKPPSTKPYTPPEVYYKPYPPNTFKPEPVKQPKTTTTTTKAPPVIYKEIKPYKPEPLYIPHEDQLGSPSYSKPEPHPSVIFKGKKLSFTNSKLFHKIAKMFFSGQPDKLKGATTPHPLVFGFKPVASLVSSALEGVFVPKKNYQQQRPHPPQPPPRPPSHPFNSYNRQPKFFFRQTYQQTKPIRFPLGFF